MNRKILLALSIILLLITIWMIFLHRAFSYNGKRQMSKQIIEGVADYIDTTNGRFMSPIEATLMGLIRQDILVCQFLQNHTRKKAYLGDYFVYFTCIYTSMEL